MLYGYIREKDVFERDYQMHLCQRLLAGSSESEHSEKSMISKLKVPCVRAPSPHPSRD
jgi:cullin 3